MITLTIITLATLTINTIAYVILNKLCLNYHNLSLLQYIRIHARLTLLKHQTHNPRVSRKRQ